MEELQQQVTGLKVKEATLTESNAEVNQRFQELNARLTDVETEHRKTKEEVRDSTSTVLETSAAQRDYYVWPVCRAGENQPGPQP